MRRRAVDVAVGVEGAERGTAGGGGGRGSVGCGDEMREGELGMGLLWMGRNDLDFQGVMDVFELVI